MYFANRIVIVEFFSAKLTKHDKHSQCTLSYLQLRLFLADSLGSIKANFYCN